jgi:hypothetical protein
MSIFLNFSHSKTWIEAASVLSKTSHDENFSCHVVVSKLTHREFKPAVNSNRRIPDGSTDAKKQNFATGSQKELIILIVKNRKYRYAGACVYWNSMERDMN